MSSQAKASGMPTDEAAQDLKKLGYTQEMTRVCRCLLTDIPPNPLIPVI